MVVVVLVVLPIVDFLLFVSRASLNQVTAVVGG